MLRISRFITYIKYLESTVKSLKLSYSLNALAKSYLSKYTLSYKRYNGVEIIKRSLRIIISNLEVS